MPTYFAQIDGNNIVINVIVADQDFVNSQPGTYVQTDVSGVSPVNYAGIGFTWRQDLNGFVPPSPYPSWTLNNTTCQWQAPVPYPTDGNNYSWNETNQTWDLIPSS